MKTAAVVQCNYVGWEGLIDASLRKDPNGRFVIEEVIARAKQLKCINDVPIIACPDRPENQVFAEIAERIGCRCFMGANTDVLGRLVEACVSAGGERMVWFQGIHYFLDAPMMDDMIAWMDAEKFDYVRCPDATGKFTLGQAVTIQAIERARAMIVELPAEQRKLFASRPFAFMRARPQHFRIGLYEPLPQYDDRTLHDMRRLAAHIYVEERAVHTGHACAVGDMSRGRYLTMLDFVPQGISVLDIACGSGYGSQLLSERAGRVIGVDISPEAIAFANAHHGQSAEFRLGNAERIPMEDNTVDLAFSIGTIEHVENDDAFVSELARVVRPGGQVVIYTPQNRMGEIPIWPWHVREYSVPWLKSVVEPHFEIEKLWGWHNGTLTVDDERGDGMYLVGSKRTH